jgi:DNA-binding NtrC family response regulator
MESPGATVLVVDDDPAVGVVLRALLEQAGVQAIHEASGQAALERLGSSPVDLVVTDLRMPGMDGIELLRRVVESWPDIPVIMLTAHGTVSTAVEAMRIGAADFLLKPFEREEVLYAVRKALQSTEQLREQPPRRATLESRIIGDCRAMRELAELVQRAAQTTATVLIRGESGTGKELVARAIHSRSPRHQAPFVPVHCAALPETLLESELFGYEKGAFTGATARKPGRVELAEGGTLFLDEIGDQSLGTQVKLLRLLQEKEYQPLGASRTHQADVRFVIATHRDLEAMVRAGEFREDLYYRANVLALWLPPLRERGQDVVQLSRHFCRTLAAQNARPGLELAGPAVGILERQGWPGNVRQLQNFIERLVILADGPIITAEEVERELGRQPVLSERTPSGATAGPGATLRSRLQQAEREAVLSALAHARQNRSLAARLLGVSRRTLYNKLDELGIE